jgi:hypothetical protein
LSKNILTCIAKRTDKATLLKVFNEIRLKFIAYIIKNDLFVPIKSSESNCFSLVIDNRRLQDLSITHIVLVKEAHAYETKKFIKDERYISPAVSTIH